MCVKPSAAKLRVCVCVRAALSQVGPQCACFWCLPAKWGRGTAIVQLHAGRCSLNLFVWVARLGGLQHVAFWGRHLMKSSSSFLTAALATKKARWVIGTAPLVSLSDYPITEAPAWELLGNQNQLLVLSPLSLFWLCVNCSVVFTGSSLWTQRPPLWPWHHRAMENLPHFLLFLQFYCFTDAVTSAGASVAWIIPVWVIQETSELAEYTV